MFTIGEAALETGLTAHTLRFYEKEGIIPAPKRISGKDRIYSEGDVMFIRFICSLKSTGMSLVDIKEIVKDGCVLEKEIPTISGMLLKRKDILQKHLIKLRNQRKEIDEIIGVTEGKLAIYEQMLDEYSQLNSDGD
ncbi:MAG: MerR family transcriptional regulator [Bacillota bacterium]|nr:MerR family transcriptional regulator [Bacillota bacterium]